MTNSKLITKSSKPSKGAFDMILEIRKAISNKFILIQFESEYILLALARCVKGKLNFNSVVKIDLSPEEIERYVPSVPEDTGTTLSKVIKEKGFLTRDARKVERIKPGQPGARKNFQFSKR